MALCSPAVHYIAWNLGIFLAELAHCGPVEEDADLAWLEFHVVKALAVHLTSGY